MNRIAFITESSTRHENPLPANQFYQSPRSRWVNAVIQYMEVRKFPTECIFFLSFQGQRIVGYDEIVEPYPRQKWHPRRSDCEMFAVKILAFVLQMTPAPFVEIHAGRTISDPLKRLFQQHGLEFRVYGDGVPLGIKPGWYEGMIEEELNQRRMKEIEREKLHVSSLIRFQTPQEASGIIEQFEGRAHLYGIEANMEELKRLLGCYRQKCKDAKKACTEFENAMGEEDTLGELYSNLQSVQSLADLHARCDFEGLKNRFGASIAKLRLYLIKHNYELMAENNVFAALQRMQIALLK
ncbi:hypothetical protein PV433_10800 [Paenibacillus sp. GYB004]|uniref:hypothetical protein n=1 Tax=Paenibacillus sp. GYB004 TaxID=2994393 RepID=UPI002F960CD8